MEANDILKVTLDKVTHSYRGKARGCWCGCKGRYAVHPDHVAFETERHGYDVADMVSLRAVQGALRDLQKLATGGGDVSVEETDGQALYVGEAGERAIAVWVQL